MQLNKNKTQQTQPQHPSRAWILAKALVSHLPLVLLLWSTCWLLTGCGKRSYQEFLQGQDPAIPSHSAIQSPMVTPYELSEQSSDETFEQFFRTRWAGEIWMLLLHYVSPDNFGNLIDEKTICQVPSMKRLLAQHPIRMQDQLKVGIEAYVQRLNQEAAYKKFLERNGLDAVWESLDQARFETSLDLSGMLPTCRPALQSQVLERMVPFIGKHCPKLVELNLSDNDLKALPDNFGNLTKLERLYLYDNQLQVLPGTFVNLTQLQKLDLDNNELEVLSESFGNLTQLSVLWLEKNDLSALPVTFVNLINLEMLDLSNNKLTALPNSFGNFKRLNQLDLSNNKLTRLPDSFGSLTKLERLFLGGNGLQALPDSFGNLINLHRLHLDSNELTALPVTFANLINLKKLLLSSNQFTRFPEYLGNLKNLKKLNLRHNQLTVLPASLGDFKNLHDLNLGQNQLTTLPDTFGKLINLEILYLHENQLTVLPGCLQKLTKLRYFKVENNPLLSLNNVHLGATDILVTRDNLQLKLFPRQEYVRQHSLNSTFNYDVNREIFELTRPGKRTTYILTYQYYPVLVFIKKLGKVTLFQPVPICIDLSGKQIVDHVYSGILVIIYQARNN